MFFSARAQADYNIRQPGHPCLGRRRNIRPAAAGGCGTTAALLRGRCPLDRSQSSLPPRLLAPALCLRQSARIAGRAEARQRGGYGRAVGSSGKRLSSPARCYWPPGWVGAPTVHRSGTVRAIRAVNAPSPAGSGTVGARRAWENKRGRKAWPGGAAGKSMAERTPNRHAYRRGQLRHRRLFGLDGGIDLPRSALEGRFTQPPNFTFKPLAASYLAAMTMLTVRGSGAARGRDPCHPRHRKRGDRERSERWGRA